MYEKEIKEKCAPLLVTPNTKYTPSTSTVVKININLHSRATYTSDMNTEEYDKKRYIHDQHINATRLLTNTTKGIQQSNSYTPTRCEVCGLTHKNATN